MCSCWTCWFSSTIWIALLIGITLVVLRHLWQYASNKKRARAQKLEAKAQFKEGMLSGEKE